MYSRENASGSRRFGVSGKLWNGVLVLIDRETQSLWTQLDGRAIQGELEGETLEHYPSVFTTFAAWVDAHPDTLVLEKPADERGQTESHYAEYFADPERLFMDHLGEGLGPVGSKVLVFGATLGQDALAVTEEVLGRENRVEAFLGDVPVRFLRDPQTGSVRVIDRRDGSDIRCDRAYWYAWKRSHPQTGILSE